MSGMFSSRGAVAVVGAIFLFTPGQAPVSAQQRAGAAVSKPVAQETTLSVPGLIQISGQLRDSAGQPLTGATPVTFAVYAGPDESVPIWTEVQTLQLDRNGRYTALLGSATAGGIPVDLFGAGEERWLGTQAAGLQEGSRTLLVSVPYALKAQDAETLGGRPASAYMLAQPEEGGRVSSSSRDGVSVAAAPPGGGGSGGTDFSARTLTATVEDAPGLQIETRIGAPMIIRSPARVANLNADLVDGHDSSAFPRLAAPNTFTANQTIDGLLTATAGHFSAVTASTSSDGSSAIRGQSTVTAGQGFGVSGTTSASVNLSAGVYGSATHPTAFTHGVFGESLGTGAAIRGIGRNATSGIGVEGLTQGASGIAMFAQVPAATGAGIGIFATVNGPNATPGLFQNNGGGNLLIGKTSGVEKFRVDGTGAVYATSFRDLSTGTPIPSGDITSVSVGTGLSGGGAAGDITVSLDSAYADSRYAPLAHGHVVGEVAGAATLGSNTFTGNQMITGDGTITGQLNIGSLRAVSSTTCCVIFAESTTTAPGTVITGKTAATNGAAAGVYGLSTASSGAGSVHGVLGETLGSVGAAVRGLARHQFGLGVEALTQGSAGTALLAQATNTTGNTTALLAAVTSPTGTAAKFQSAGGDLIVGQQGAVKFRVDGTGAVYASSYRDLAGTPIPSGTGDITGVAASSGLTGGGASGEVSLALDTGFTDGRYALKAHGHNVSEVTNAATLGANSFSGHQTISGNLSASGTISAPEVVGNVVTGPLGSFVRLNAINTDSFQVSNALLGRSHSANGTAIVAEAIASSGTTFGLRATAASTGGTAIRGNATAASGSTVGVLGDSASANGVGVYGIAASASGFTKGVYGQASSPDGIGVFGAGATSTGRAVGVLGNTSSTAGVGVEGQSPLGFGSAIGVRGIVSSPDAVSAEFVNRAGGTILSGRAGAGESTVFRVDGTGAVYASAYKDLLGNPLPTGTGDITAVASGAGLTGGGASGDVVVALDTAFTDSRYAGTAHTHTVAQVAGAATLGANSFGGNQSISGTLTATGTISASGGTLSASSGQPVLSVSNTAANPGTAIYGAAIQGSGPGVRGVSGGVGVWGESIGSFGLTLGVYGQSSSGSGVAVRGEALAATGAPVGVQGIVKNGTTGNAVHGQHQNTGPGGIGVFGSHAGGGWGVNGTSVSGVGVRGAVSDPAGVAGVFENAAGGNLIVGQVNGVTRFRVDGTGQVFTGGADFAESVAVSGDRLAYEPGDVLIIDATQRRSMQKSLEAYSTMVAGIYSTKPGVLASPHPDDHEKLNDEVPLAVVGIVPTKVTTENGPIRPGDLLVTSSLPGHAMKGSDRTRMLGAIVGKALEPLDEATGVIMVLVTLQ